GRGLLGKTVADATADTSSAIQVGWGCLGVINLLQPNKFGVVTRLLSRARNDILSFYVTGVGIYFLRRPGFSRNDEAGDRRCGGGPAVAHHPTQRTTNLFRRFLGDHLPNNRRRKFADCFAVGRRN